MTDWLDILKREVAARGSKAAVARELGYARTTISLVYGGNYPGDTSRIAAKVLAVFASKIDCPFTKTEITRDACQAAQSGPMPTNSADQLRHWTTCQRCPRNTGSAPQPEISRRKS